MDENGFETELECYVDGGDLGIVADDEGDEIVEFESLEMSLLLLLFLHAGLVCCKSSSIVATNVNADAAS